MQQITIKVKLEPTKSTHQSCLRVMRRRGGGVFIGKYAKSSVKVWVAEFSRQIASHRPPTPWDCPTGIYINFRFPHLKSSRDSVKEKTQWKLTRPDLDNMEKVILDALTEQGFLRDDSIICSKTTEKCHSVDYGIDIILRKLLDEPS